MIASAFGKFSELGSPNHIIMEMGQFLQSIEPFLPSETLSENPYFRQFIVNRELIKIEEFSDYLAQTLPSPRINWY